MSKRSHSAMEASSVNEPSGSNVVSISETISGQDLPFNRQGLLDLTRLTDDDLEMLYVDDDGGTIESDTDDDDWVPNGHASDEELEDYAVEYNATVEDDANIEEDADVDSDAAEDVSLTANYMAPRLNELPLSQKLIARDGTEWAKEPFLTYQTSSRNVLRELGGPTIKRLNTRVNTFNSIFRQPMKTVIIRHTNRKGQALAALWNKKNPHRDERQWQNIDEIEFDAFLAILLVMGVHKSNCELLSELWTRQANCIYRASMSRERFKAILTTIRFDDANTREARKATDKAAPISELWLMMNDNLKKNYKPHAWITIDEQLFPFRGRVSFKQYIPSKPAKYGLKVFWAADAKTHYPLGGIIYLGRQPGADRARNMGENVVLQLVKPYENSGRNITTDNFFTTLPLAEMLATRKLTLIGTLRKDKRYIAKELMWKKGDNVGTSVFAYRENCTMVAYTAKHKKNVILLSSMHFDSEIDAISGKPQIILDYNKTKGGVDTMDQMVTAYSCKRKTNRWPLAMFFNMVDIMTLAAYLIFIETHRDTTSRTTRRVFITKLASELAQPHISRRALNPMVTRIPGVRSAIEDMLDCKLTDSLPRFDPVVAKRDSSGRIKTQGKCHICPRQRNTRKRCMVCNKPVCDEHTQRIVKCLSCQ